MFKEFEDQFGEALMKLVYEFAIPWFERCIRIYTEEEWHRRMASDWNLYDDWQEHHYEKYWAYVRRVRRVRKFIKWDSAKFTEKVIELLNKKAGWKVTEHEKKKIYQTIERVRRDVYI